MLSRTLGAALTPLLFLVTVSCTTSDQKPAPSHGDQDPAPLPLDSSSASVAHRDPRLGVPSFVWFNRSPSTSSTSSASGAPPSAAQTAFETAHVALPSIARAFGATTNGLTLSHIDDHGKGPILARYEQRVGDVEVFRGGVSLLMTRGHQAVAASGFLAPSFDGTLRPFILGSIDALTVGARVVAATATTAAASSSSATSFTKIEERDGYEHFNAAGLRLPARTKKVFFPVKSEHDQPELEPAFYVELLLRSGPSRGLIVSALDGRVLLDHDFVAYDAFQYQVYADPESKLPTDGPQGSKLAPHPTGIPDHMQLTYEPSQLVTLQNFPFSKNDPWLAPTATTTNGNNVSAYVDIAEPDGLTVGKDSTSSTTADKAFAHVFDTNASPTTSESSQAAVTNLFYITNFLHDWYYDAGFDEKAGNHQSTNFNRGGLGADALHAEAHDFSGRNNANASTPPDGTSPRIQMFLFSGASNSSLVVGVTTKTVGIASGFGDDIFDISGAVVLSDDSGGADPADACEPIENDVTGKIALIHRGTCSFAQKAANAQAAGAIGALIANTATSASPTTAPFMGGTQGGITIPVLSLNEADGQQLEAATVGTIVNMKRALQNDLDGALDTSIVVHEWGHVLSNRLIGNGMGLTTNQSGGLGEGWSDFVALILTARPDDPNNFGGAYANGSYATSGSGDDVYYGVRRVPYSIDFTKNALTLKHISNGTPLPSGVATSFGEDGSFNAEAHSTGEVWASMLWECYASLLRDRGLAFNEAQDRMKRYLVASLKLTPTDPTIIEARDAMLAAVLATDEQDFQLFWKAFAKRGAGAGALGPPKDSTTNQGVKESFEFGNDLQIVETKLADDVISCDHDGILDEGEVGTIEVTVRNTGSGPLSATKAELVTTSKTVTLLDAEPAQVPPLKPFESGKTKLKARVTGSKKGEPVDLDIAVSDPSLPNARVVHVVLPTRYDADQAASASAIDHVDTTKTAWKVVGDGSGEKWARSPAIGDGHWALLDPPGAADHKLASPTFTITETTFTLAFKHKWQMKRSTRRNVDIDGGVIELSVDSGKTWSDISTYGKVDYNTTIDTGGRGDNPLKGRKAYGNKSEGYPDQWITSRIDVTLPEHPENVQVRFRVGAGSGRAGADGWSIDDIELVGASSSPFYAFVPQADECDPNGPTVSAGPNQTVPAKSHVAINATATHPTDKPLTIMWTQTAGPKVTLKDETTLTPSFDAFDTGQRETVTFVLRAHDGALLSPASKIDIVVEPLNPEASEGCTCRTTGVVAAARSNEPLALGLLLGLFALARRSRRPN